MTTSTITRGVNFYSYQEEVFKRSMTLEDCVAEVASMGAVGVQLMTEAAIPGYPNPSQEWIEAWTAMMQRYGTVPTALMTFWDFNKGGHRMLSVGEAYEIVEKEIRLARALGFDILRPSPAPAGFPELELIEKLLPVAEEANIRLSFEVHAPHNLIEHTAPYIEIVERTGTKHLGLTLDMSCFQKRYPRIARDRLIRDGVLRERIACHITESRELGLDKQFVTETVKRWGGTQPELSFVNAVYNPMVMQSLDDLKAIIPYIFNVHAKIFEMTDQLMEYSLAYEEVIPLFVKAGWSGSIDTEYEGQRHTQDLGDSDSCEQIRRNQLQLRYLLGEL
ncbi:sugar phosphate isomerase/epimerase family protein [Novosphingobium mathurense]|uniref:Sugar phosphate isomerase/epimerase n=1 Tax=Novosphingobium mathurense TaxID=428990 RepID=A0A1U6IXR3_9SPHN|nr:TIM barrel protein [Novosphingobium mathurense]SLK12804.1 Sugar phosphate isomerase/epimerase [Novosphingobium mathurense]